jgi:hypothetical protein
MGAGGTLRTTLQISLANDFRSTASTRTGSPLVTAPGREPKFDPPQMEVHDDGASVTSNLDEASGAMEGQFV